MSPESLIGNDRSLYIRMLIFHHAGDQEPEHTHPFGHHFVLFKGRALLYVKGVAKELTAPVMVYIDAEEKHQVTALEDDVQGACIHDIRNLQEAQP